MKPPQTAPSLAPTVETFRSYAIQNVTANRRELEIECITIVSEFAKLSGNSQLYSDPYLLVQLASGARGCCFASADDLRPGLQGFVGRSALDALQHADDLLSVALLDAVYLGLDHPGVRDPSYTRPYSGTAEQNGKLQGSILADLLTVEPGDTILVVGVVEDIVNELVARRANVQLHDLILGGGMVAGRAVSSDPVASLVGVDKILLTGNTLKTQTLSFYLQAASEASIPSVVFAMSGGSLAPLYLGYGATAVTVERFPFFWYPGISPGIEVYH